MIDKFEIRQSHHNKDIKITLNNGIGLYRVIVGDLKKSVILNASDRIKLNSPFTILL